MGQPTMAPIKRHTRYLHICVKGENRPPGNLLNTLNPTPLLHVCTCAGTRARPGLNVDPRHLSVLGAADECSTPANTRTCARTRGNPSATIVACILSIDPDTKRSLPCGRLTTTKVKPTIQKTKRKNLDVFVGQAARPYKTDADCRVVNWKLGHLEAYLPDEGEPQINKCGPWGGAGHCTPVL